VSSRLWERPTELPAAVEGLRSGRTVVGGGAALASQSFPPQLGPRALDLSGLGLDSRRGPVVGASVTLETLLQDVEVGRGWPALADALRGAATPEVRRLATLGGSVAARLPTSDVLPVLCAYRARLDVVNVEGSRYWLAIADYLAGQEQLLVLNIDLGARAPGAFRRFAGRPGFAPALASVVGVQRNGTLEIWAGAVAPNPIAIGLDELPDEESLRGDDYASAWYRRRLLEVLRDEVVDAIRSAEEVG
jgi:CO/xanthine dehydrogenase FAD-binding subunit